MEEHDDSAESIYDLVRRKGGSVLREELEPEKLDALLKAA